ncbi:F-box domain protein [Apiospora phragmitis]|uniref:F-box domain protein n=1 Tax=Apiospora phragmitis TaxID=2905665 RepID=A0ABR1T350_9PEZI
MHHDHHHEWTVAGPPGQTVAPPLLTQDSSSSSSSPKAAELNAASSDAQHRVLHTPELLETILAGCGDMRAVLHAQRVSVFWRDAIRASPLLQCMLYFEPVAPFAPDESLSPEELRDSFALNPLLCHYFPQWLRADQRQQMGGTMSFARRHYREDEAVSDIDLEEVAEEDEADGHGGSSKSVPVPLFPPERRDAFTRAGASWRRMLVCQPASLGLGYTLVRPAATMSPDEQQRRSWLTPVGWRQPQGGWIQLAEARWVHHAISMGRVCGFLETPVPKDDDGEGGGLRMGTLFDICLQQHLYYGDQGRQGRHSYLDLHWVPPGYDGLYPYNQVGLQFRPFTPNLGVSVFAVLEDVVHHRGFHPDGQRTTTELLSTEELETFRCEEHTDRQFTQLRDR